MKFDGISKTACFSFTSVAYQSFSNYLAHPFSCRFFTTVNTIFSITTLFRQSQGGKTVPVYTGKRSHNIDDIIKVFGNKRRRFL